jgi:hypothetical protein
MISSRTLDIVIPAGNPTAVQKQVLADIAAQAAKLKIQINFFSM